MWDYTVDETPARVLGNPEVETQWRPENNTETLETTRTMDTILTIPPVCDIESDCEFSGKDIEQPAVFIQRVERHLRENRIPTNKIEPVVRRVLEGEALSWFKRIERPELPWKIFKAQFLAKYDSLATRANLRKQLYGRPQFPDESAYSFTMEKWALFQRLAPETPTQERTSLILELLRPATRVILRGRVFSSLETLLEVVGQMEGDLREDRSRGQPRSTPPAPPPREVRRAQPGTRDCYNCGGDHFVRDCPQQRQGNLNDVDGISAERCPRVMLDLEGRRLTALVDTGASENFLRTSWLTTKERQTMSVGRNNIRLGRIQLNTCIQQVLTPMMFTVVDDLREEVVLENPWREDFARILRKHARTFSEIQRPATTLAARHNIILRDAVPVRSPTYRCTEARKRAINEEVAEMLRSGIIRRSASDYSSPVVMVPKKDGTSRLCVDYRGLNAKTVAEVSHLPPIPDTHRELGTARVFTTLDLKSGYWQVPVAEEAKRYTAFTTPDGASFEFNMMPFGLAGAPGTFQKLMVGVLEGYLHRFAKVYLDDIVIYSDNLEDHAKHLDLVLERLGMHELVCAPTKCVIAGSQIEYLGHVITENENVPQQNT
ncbi:uncharacterized protein LOC108916531 [Anoplophora glabripennis]|uniref:uncharacterized protein LOC108916531 n=1 Tax=Anoplophora glabripennis TaxID=217634 RepID=UPI000C794847|nr:uncharacterized protein LOC108916531 [Anoplophora glabripennis]